MSKSAFTIKLFGYYLLGLGSLLLVDPNLPLTTFLMPVTSEAWIRVVGILVVNTGDYYHFC